MPNSVSITADDLEFAFDWVNAGDDVGNAAYISKADGKIYYVSDYSDSEEEILEDIDEPELYWMVPNKRELDLGRELVLRFVEQHAPDEWQTVRSYFQNRGAYARFKDLLTRLGQLEKWYEFEQQETAAALRTWATDNGLTVTS